MFSIACAASFGATGCAATYRDEYVAYPMDDAGHLAERPDTPLGIVVSGEEKTGLSSPDAGLLQVTFENNSSNWITITHVAFGFGSSEKDASVYVPSGEALAAWADAIEARNEIRAEATATGAGVAELFGIVTAIAGYAARSRAATAAGVAVAAGAATVRDSTGSVAVPPRGGGHLLDVPFIIPPKLFSKRWLVLSTSPTRSPCIDAMRIEYDTATGEHQRVWLHFRDGPRRSEWQRKECEPEGPSLGARPGG